MRKILTVLIAAFAVNGNTAAAVGSDPAFGHWLVENGKAIIEIGPCDAASEEHACGRIVWLERPHDDAGALKTDTNNPDPALQSRPLCGIELIGGFERDSAGHWKDGWIYNARNGERYDARLTVSDEDKLEVRGFVGIALLGSSQYWTRVPDPAPAPGCPE